MEQVQAQGKEDTDDGVDTASTSASSSYDSPAKDRELEADFELALALQASDEQALPASPVPTSLRKRQKIEKPDVNTHNLAELLCDLLVLTSRSTPLLADVSVYKDLQLILSQATHLFVHPPTPHMNATFTAICEVFNTWLRGISDLSKELILAVWLADSIWRWQQSVVLETKRYPLLPGDWLMQQTAAGRILAELHTAFDQKFKGVLTSPNISPMLTAISQTNTAAIKQFEEQLSKMAIALLTDGRMLSLAFSVLVQACSAAGKSMAISGPVSNPLQSWTSLFDRLRSSGLSFKQMLEVMADAKWSPLYVEGLPALYKARVLCYLLCEVAARYRYPRESSDLEWFGRQLGGSCKAELLQTLGRPFGELMLRRKRPGAFLAALMRGLSAEESPDMPLQAATSFMTTMIESMQTALKPCHQQACHAIMTDLLEQLPDDIVTALQQAVSHMAEQGQLKTDMLIALVELPLEVASEVFQAAFRADAFNDTRNASDDALLFDAATVDAPPEQSLALLTAALVRKQKAQSMSGYWAKTATDIDFVKRLAIFMSESARLQEADIPFDAAHSHFQTMFSEVLKAGLHSRGMKHFNSLQHVCDSWEQASHLTVGQGAALAYFQHLTKSVQGTQTQMDPSLRFGLRVMFDLVPRTSKAWLGGSANAALPLTVMLAIYQQCTQPLLDAPLDELFQVMVTPLSELQRLWHLTDFIRGQAEHDSVPAAARLLTLQASIQDKLDALLQPHVMAELPYKSVSQLHKTLLSMLESASDSQSTNPFSQLTSICASAQDAIDFIHTHVDPINSSSASLMTGWSVFWGIALHSGIAVPATLHSRSSRMAGEPAAVTSSDIQSFTELCFATHGLVDGSDDLVFLLHMLTQDSALFQGYLMQHLKQYSNKQPGPSAWPGSSAPSEADAAADSSMLSFAPSAAPSSSAQDAAGIGIAQAIRKTRLSMQRLSTDPAVTIDMLDTAHQFMQAKDQERELQVVFKYFMPANAALEQAAQQIQRFQEAMLLSAWVDRLPEVLAVVEQYNLQNCKGPGTAALQSMLDETFAAEHRQQLPVSEVPRHLAAIQSVCGKVSPVELRLFGAIQHCDAFFNFLQEQEFFGSNGVQRFEGIVQNLNGVLMFEEYNMRVLADVQQARKLMEPFLRAESLSDLFDKVRGLKLQASSKAATTPDAQLFACCRTVSLHIQQIQQWFSNSADQSMDSISLQLQRLSSGVFQIQLQQSRQTQATVCIKYKIDASADAVQQALDEQALTDLVKRLYLDQQDTTESQGPSSSNQELQTFSSRIASFLQLCQDLKTLTELHIALSQAGQPHYLQHTYMYLLQDDLAGQINVIQAGLQQWRGFLAQLHSCNPVLLFLSVRQLHECVRCLAAAQTAGNIDSHDKVVTDVQSILMLIPELRKVTLQQLSETLPASLVGLTLQPEAQPQQRFDAMASAVQRIISAIGSQAAAPEPGQKALLLSSDEHNSLHRVLVTLFAGPPAPGLVFWASQSSTEDQLEQFLLCASSNRHQFCLACMEQLPVQLREHVLQFQIKAAAEQTSVRILYVVSAGYDSIMTSMSWLPLEQVTPTPAASFRQAAQVRPHVHVFTGPAGSGKTYAVQEKLQSARTAGKQVVQMSMNEDASSASLIKSLGVLENSATTSAVIALHISSFAPTSVVNQLLFQLLVEGLVADPSTGSTFALPPNTALLVELAAPVSAGGLVNPSAATLSGNPSAPDSSPHHVPVVVDCASSVQAVQNGSGTQATTFDTARFRPPQSLTLSALKLYFAQHPQDRQRRVLDTKLDEVPRVNQAVADVGLTSANGQLSFGQVRVTQEEGARLLQQLLNELVRLSGRAEVANLSMLQLHHFLAHLEQRASFLQDHLHLIDEMFQYAGSILMETMLCECLSLVDKQMLQLDWSEYPHSFLVYMQGGLKVVSLPNRQSPVAARGLQPYPESKMSTWINTIARERKLYCNMPSQAELHKPEFLIATLAAALLGRHGLGNSQYEAIVHDILAKNKYIMTPDYKMKMLHIEARRQAHVPTIMSSETGVGKTKSLHVYSQIINSGIQHHLKLHNALKAAIQSHAASVPQGAAQHAVRLQQAFNHLADVPASSMDVNGVLQALLHLVAHLAGYTAMPVPAGAQVWQPQPEPIATEPQTITALLTQLKAIITEHLINQPVLQVGQFVYVQSELIVRATAAQASSGAQIAEAAQEAAAHWHLLPKHAQATQTALGSTNAFKQGKGVLAAAFDLTPDQIMADFSAFGVLLAAVAAALATEMHPMLTVLPMHAKVDQQQLSDSLQPVVSLAKACPDYTFTFFVDELNTSSITGDLKDIFTDQRFMGQLLPRNIFLVAAINPYRKKAVQAIADGSQASDDSYNVRELPDSMLELVWDFGSLSVEQEKAYIAAKLRMSTAHVSQSARLGKLQDQKLASFITQAQGFVKQHLGASAVSQRDLQRAFRFFDFFLAHHQARRVQLEEEKLMHRCLLLSIAMTYYFRLPAATQQSEPQQASLRHKFCQMVAELQSPATSYRQHDMPWDDFEDVVADELQQYIVGAQLPRGIAANLALMENFFCIAVCMQTKTPLIIVGTPGNSKTLSLKLAAERLRGEHGPYPFFRTFDAMDVFPYQCSEQSTSHEIKTVVERAIERQQQYNHHRQKSTVAVVLDEGGLPKDEGEALKIVHYFWDNAEVAFVTISNTPLDAAKTNRAAVVFRSEPTSEDLSRLAYSFFKANTVQDCSAFMQHCIQACCQAYSVLVSREGTGEKRHLRDFHHFIKYFSRRCRDASGMPQVNTQTVVAALERNFGGNSAEEFQAIVDAFLHHLRTACGADDFPHPSPAMYRNALDVLVDSLADRHISGEHLGNQQASLSNVAARPILIIDHTGDDSASRMLFSHGVLDIDTEVFQLSQFPDDLTMEGCSRMISLLRLAIERGKKIFMMYTEPIHGSFYDLFNQFFTVRRDMQDQQEVVSLYVNIAIGPYSRPCRVHPKTQILVHTPARLLHALPPPFLDRFEKYSIGAGDFWDKMCQQQSPETQAVMQYVLQKLNQFVEMLGVDTFAGFTSSTAVTALMATVQQQLVSAPATGTVSSEQLSRSLLRGAISRLLQTAKPHKMLQHRFAGSGLPQEYLNHFINTQPHFSFKAWLTCLLTGDLGSLGQCMPLSGDATMLHPEASTASKKWVVSTNTCASIAMLPQGVFAETGDSCNAGLSPTVVRLVQEQPEGLALYKLSGQLSTRHSCQAAVTAAANAPRIHTAIFTINMQQTSQRQVSMLRNMIDEAVKVHTGSPADVGSSDEMVCDSMAVQDKNFILLLHHLPGDTVVNQYPALFLHGWDFWHLDSFASSEQIGSTDKMEGLQMDRWLQAAAPWDANSAAAPPVPCGPDRAGFSNTAGLQAMQLVKVHTSYSRAIGKVNSLVAAGSPEVCVLAFYDGTATPSQRWDALKPFLDIFGDTLLQRFSSAWTPDAIAFFSQQAADDVEAGLAGNLEAALSARYSTLQATFLASVLHQLAGTDFNLLACVSTPLWQAAAEYQGSAALAEGLLGCFETKTIPELHRLQGLGWTLCHHAQADRPVRSQCPCFARMSASVNAAKEALHPTIPVPAVASSDAVEASLQATLQSSKLAALDTHLQQNPILHQAYLQELAAGQTLFMASQEGQALLVPFATATLQSLWIKRPSLAGLHTQLHCNQQEMSVCFWLLQLTGQLPAADLRTFVIKSRDDAITAVADTLAISLTDMLNQQPADETFKALKHWQETVYAAIPHFSARQSHGYRKALLMASHCISCAKPTHVSSLQQLLRTVVNECNSSTSQPGSYMIRLSEQTSGLEFDITPALLAIIGDVVQQFCCMQQPGPLQIQELRRALQLAFSPALKAPSGWQDHQIAQLLDEARPKQLLQAVWCQIQDTLTGLVQEPLPTLLTLPEPLQADLVYVPPFMRNREDAVPAAWKLADSLYWVKFKQATAATQHAQIDLVSKIADLHHAMPRRPMEPDTAIMAGVQCIAMTHACICILATQLACPDKRQQLVAHLSSQEVAAALQAIFAASRHHEHLLLTAVAKAVPNNQQVLTGVLQAPAAALLGEWVQPWQQAFRTGRLAHQPYHMSVTRTESYQMLSRKFQTLIVPHATETLQQPSDAAQAAAIDFCAYVVALASEHGRKETSQMLLLVMYHELFDVGRVSMALSHELNRLQSVLGWQQELAIFQMLSAGSGPDLQHADPGAAVTRMFARGPQADYDLATQRHCIINLLSVMLRVPTCHMATFMLQPELLRQTWLVGSTYPAVNAHYDCGCVLDEQHSPVNARAPLTDPASVYFVHILSFSALLLGHLLLPGNHAKLYDPVLSTRQIHSFRGNEQDSDWRWLSDFMYMRVETCWHGLIRRAGLDALGRSLTLTAAIEEMATALTDNPVTQPTFQSAEARAQYESVLKDTFHQQLMARPQLEEKYVLEANGGQLQQQLQVFAAALPWVYELQVAALANSSAHHMTLLDHLALQVAQQEQQGRQASPLLEHTLAQQGKWEHLQLIPLGIEMYQWANDNLTGLATEEAVRSTSLHQYLQRAQYRDSARAQRLAQVYQRFKHSWNAFHKAQDGYMRDECREDAKFELITDSTPLSFFISWQDPAADDYILRVLKNVVDIQNRFMAVAQEAMPSATIHAAPASLLRDPTLALGLLDSRSLNLEHTVASFIQNSTSPTPAFDLAGLTARVVSWLQSKQTITDDLSQIRQVFKPWQPGTVAPEAPHIGGVEGIRPLDIGLAQSLPLAYKQPMPRQQHSTLSSHMGSMSFEQLQTTVHALQQVAAALVHHTPLAVPAPSQPAQRRSLQPTDPLSAAIAAANPDSKLKSADCVNGLAVAHTHAVLLMAAEKMAGQSHLYAHLPQFVKVPLPDAQGKELRNSLQRGLLADPQRAEVLSELLTDLRSYEGTPGQGSALLASASKPLGQFCANFGYDDTAFPLTSFSPELCCEHYVAVVQIIKQVLAMHWKRSAKAKQQQMFTEDASSVPDGGLTTDTMSLPVWVDMPLHYKAVSRSHGEQEASAGDQDMSLVLADDNSQACNDHLMQCDEPCQSLLLQTAPEQASGPDMDAGCTVTKAAEVLTLEAAFGEKEAAWLKDHFMKHFGALLQPVGVFVAEDLLLLTPEQAQTICWSDSKKPFTVAKKKLQRLLQQVSQEQRVMAVLHRFEDCISELLSTDMGAHAAHEVADLLRDYDNQDDFTVEMQQVDLPRLAQQVLLLEFQSVMRDT